MDEIEQLINDIKSVKIQGATNVALATLQGIRLAANTVNKTQNDKYLYKIAHRLAFARPTEPLAQNALRFIFHEKNQSVNYYLKKSSAFENLIVSAKKKMADTGLQLVKNGGVYLTHCHSSTVTNMFITANKSGKKFSVIATETRPLFQGRITVK